ncbi:MAG: amidase [Actinomycetota bacterium]
MTPSASELARRFADGEQSPVEVIEDLLATIDRLDPDLGAWQSIDADGARRSAGAAADRMANGGRLGPFHGIPFALKDIVELEGGVATAGSATRLDHVAPATATIARRLLAAGGILLGKTKTVEFALGGWGTNEHLGTPRNPWDAGEVRVPGGSSSGSGVAVASGMVPVAVGTDTGGSVRLPAALCGIVGLKTTEGLLPTDGIVPLSHTLDTPGPMARSVDDASLTFDVLRGTHPVDLDDAWRAGSGWYGPGRTDLRGMTFGSISDGDRASVSAPVLTRYDLALERLVALGAEVRPVAMPLPYDELKELTFVIVTAEAWHHHGTLLGDDDAPIDRHVRARGRAGRDLSAGVYIDALVRRRELRRRYLAGLEGIDALVTPGTPATAPTLDEVDESDTPAHFTRAGNLLALAALTVPCGLTEEGLPAAIQFVGRGGDEAELLAIGRCFERDRGPLPPPPLH